MLQREIADPIALELLQGNYRDGDVIQVDASPDGLVFHRIRRLRVGVVTA